METVATREGEEVGGGGEEGEEGGRDSEEEEGAEETVVAMATSREGAGAMGSRRVAEGTEKEEVKKWT
ncbi:hypothetical protein GBAR_LOCUS15873 [Geodia barretti]|uniref:Uncharacterized protein n=1 Tax=Geodia barretti TaxID=519541 RepID=A0AA35WV81_GEOBA|nr:hypothetical protein GBAR_LOCUS15873 [Geodia barretti]